MRTILIVFAILLVLLTLLGTFGGSIKYREPFYEVSTFAEQEQRHSKMNFEDMPPQIDMPSSDMPSSDGMNVPMSDMPPMGDEMPLPPPETDYGSVDMSNIVNSLPVEGFYQGPSVPMPPGYSLDKAEFMDFGELPQAPQMQVGQPHPPASMNPSMEGFMIEPFEQDSQSSYPAAY